MATLEQCKQALERLAARLHGADGDDRKRHEFDRTLSAHVSDLHVTFAGRLEDAHLYDITTYDETTGAAPKAQIRLTARSDDLVALTSGDLDFARAWLSGKVKVEGGVRDLLTLRSML